MKYSRILGVAAALLVTSAMASPATPPPAASSTTAAPAAASTAAPPAAATVPATPVADATPAHWGDAKAGQAKSGTCAACHGADGNSTDAQYPKLASTSA